MFVVCVVSAEHVKQYVDNDLRQCVKISIVTLLIDSLVSKKSEPYLKAVSHI